MHSIIISTVLLASMFKVPEVPAAWENHRIAGHDMLFATGIEYLKNPAFSDLDVFRDVWYMKSIFAEVNDYSRANGCIPHYKGKPLWAVPTPEEDRFSPLPYKLDDILRWNKIDGDITEFERIRPGYPISLNFYNHRPCFNLKDRFDADVADFAEWRKRHPSFYGFFGMDEFDNDQRDFRMHRPKETNDHIRRRWDLAFPDIGDDFYKMQAWVDEGYRRTKAMYFGCEDIQVLCSINPTFLHELCRGGAKFIQYEAEMGSSGTYWEWGAMCVRGASRQFSVPWGWYATTYEYANYTREGKQVEGFIQLKSKAFPGANEKRGCSRSMLKRSHWYGCFIGGASISTELGGQFFSVDDGKGGLKPSDYLLDLNEVFKWNQTHDRGVSYTPVALLTSLHEHFQCQHYRPWAKDFMSIPAFMQTLVPTMHTNLVTMCDRDHGKEGGLCNSPFGELCDVLIPDLGQEPSAFLKALKDYPRAFLVGWFDKERLDTATLVGYVKAGGTLYVEQAHVDQGLVPAAIPEAKGRLVVVSKYLPNYYYRKDVAWWPDMMAKLCTGAEPCPVIRDLLMKAQDELLPVKVDGDIQWGVNKTAKGWLVWLINNKGVTKYALEDEIIDASQASRVKVTYKPTGKVYETTVAAGDIGWIEM